MRRVPLHVAGSLHNQIGCCGSLLATMSVASSHISASPHSEIFSSRRSSLSDVIVHQRFAVSTLLFRDLPWGHSLSDVIAHGSSLLQRHVTVQRSSPPWRSSLSDIIKCTSAHHCDGTSPFRDLLLLGDLLCWTSSNAHQLIAATACHRSEIFSSLEIFSVGRQQSAHCCNDMSPFRDLLLETFPVGRHQTCVSAHGCDGTQPFRDLLLETFSVVTKGCSLVWGPAPSTHIPDVAPDRSGSHVAPLWRIRRRIISLIQRRTSLVPFAASLANFWV